MTSTATNPHGNTVLWPVLLSMTCPSNYATRWGSSRDNRRPVLGPHTRVGLAMDCWPSENDYSCITIVEFRAGRTNWHRR